MQCERSRELLNAYHDQELDLLERREVAAHLETCSNCNAIADEIQHISQQLAALGREPVSTELPARITAALAKEDAQASSRLTRILAVHAPGLLRQAAVLAIACGLTALATTMIFSRAEKSALLEREVVSAHLRSLLQESPIQVASSDTHAVKPWFSGRVDFSPPVKDLTVEGFPLLGGRVDYIGGRRVAALVYRRNLHIVNVFLWPSDNRGEVAPRVDALKGYNVLLWNNGGITYWAVSDLNGDELRQLQSLLQ